MRYRMRECGRNIEKQRKGTLVQRDTNHILDLSDLFFSFKSFPYFFLKLCLSKSSSTLSSLQMKREQKFGMEQPGCGIEGA